MADVELTLKQKKKQAYEAKMYTWIIKHGFPKDFGLLCANCNKAEYNKGVCPHKAMSADKQVAA